MIISTTVGGSLSDGHRYHRLRMPMQRPAQVTGHQIDCHGCQHDNHTEPYAPIPMGAPPIRRMPLINRAAMRISVRLVIRLQFSHKISRFHQPLLRFGGMSVIEVMNV